MKRAVFLALLAFCLTGALLSFAVADVEGASLDKIVVGPRASGTGQSLVVGNALVVRLPSNPSTGFAWQVRSDTRPVLVLVGRTYRPPKSQLVGAAGTAVFRFRAARVGKAVARLAYVRPWESGVEPARTSTLRVTVLR